jgi:hypothetical protein
MESHFTKVPIDDMLEIIREYLTAVYLAQVLSSLIEHCHFHLFHKSKINKGRLSRYVMQVPRSEEI